MLFVLSPAKALDFSAPDKLLGMTAPQFPQDVAELAKTTRKLTVADLKRLMSLSDNLAELNRARFQAFDPDSEDGLQAALAFNGDVYAGLRARQMSKEGWADRTA